MIILLDPPSLASHYFQFVFSCSWRLFGCGVFGEMGKAAEDTAAKCHLNAYYSHDVEFYSLSLVQRKLGSRLEHDG